MVVAHRVRIVRVCPAERGGESVGPGLLNVERNGIREQRFEPLRSDLRCIQIEAIGFGCFKIEPQACKLIHDRAAERRWRAHQVKEQSIHRRECADEHERERIVFHE